MTTDEEYSSLKNQIDLLETRLQKLEKLLDDKNHDLFEKWFRDFLDDKCNGGW